MNTIMIIILRFLIPAFIAGGIYSFGNKEGRTQEKFIIGAVIGIILDLVVWAVAYSMDGYYPVNPVILMLIMLVVPAIAGIVLRLFFSKKDQKDATTSNKWWEQLILPSHKAPRVDEYEEATKIFRAYFQKCEIEKIPEEEMIKYFIRLLDDDPDPKNKVAFAFGTFYRKEPQYFEKYPNLWDSVIKGLKALEN